MAGINRALISGYDRIIYENKVIQNNSTERISHRRNC